MFAGGKLSGEVGDPIVDAMAKRDALIEVRDQLGLAERRRARRRRRRQRQADDRGSGARHRLQAKPALVEVADAELKYHGLDALLWVQGVRRRDWFRRLDYFAGTGKQARAERLAGGLRRGPAFERARPGAG